MTTLADLRAPEGLGLVARIPRDAVQRLWASAFYDGPLSGLLLYAGERSWFEMVAENDDPDLSDWPAVRLDSAHTRAAC